MSPAYTHRWIQTSDKPSEQTYEFDTYKTTVIGTAISPADQQVRQATEQPELTRQYRGRDPRRN